MFQLSAETLKWGSLVLVVLHNVTIVMLKRESRVPKSDDHTGYIASTCVFFAELFKLITSLLMHIFMSPSIAESMRDLHKHFVSKPREFLQTIVPAVLFTVQNNLLIIALTHLAAGTFQVVYQMKIPVTAVVSVMLLGTKLTFTKWFAVGILMIGGILMCGAAADSQSSKSLWLGLAAVIPACFTSAFACVYTEKLLKQTDASLWLRNVQLSVWSLLTSVCIMSFDSRIRTDGILTGYDKVVWAVAVVNGIGGLIIAASMKYAGNILKCFASGLAIAALYGASVFYFHELVLTAKATTGVGLTVTALLIYTADAQSPDAQPLLEKTEKTVKSSV